MARSRGDRAARLLRFLSSASSIRRIVTLFGSKESRVCADSGLPRPAPGVSVARPVVPGGKRRRIPGPDVHPCRFTRGGERKAMIDFGTAALTREMKIFVTSGKRCEAVVIWATVDRKKGRAAIKSFVVEKSRPGIRITKLEHKLGIRASDTAAIVLEDCRIPCEGTGQFNMLIVARNVLGCSRGQLK